jgi:hypothetical protein
MISFTFPSYFPTGPFLFLLLVLRALVLLFLRDLVVRLVLFVSFDCTMVRIAYLLLHLLDLVHLFHLIVSLIYLARRTYPSHHLYFYLLPLLSPVPPSHYPEYHLLF